MSNSAAQSRLTALRWRFESEGRRAGALTAWGLLGLGAAGLVLFCSFLSYAWSAVGATPVPPLARGFLFLLTLGSLLLAAFFFVRSLLASGAGEYAPPNELRLNPGLAFLGVDSPGDSSTAAALERLSTQYGAAAGWQSTRNAVRTADLSTGGWSLLAATVLLVALLAWIFLGGTPLGPNERGDWLQFARSGQPAEISQDRSLVPATAGSSAFRGSELDGACCLFEDRRPTKN